MAWRTEAGDTLIEVLIGVVILAFCVTAIMGALTTTLASSGEHRSLAADETLLNSMAEQIKDVVELQSSPNWPGGSSGDCPSGTLLAWYQSTNNVPLPSTLTSTGSNYPLTLTNAPYVGYTINLTPAVWTNAGAWSSTCPSGTVTGIQKVTIKVSAPTGVSQTVDVIVRKQADATAG